MVARPRCPARVGKSPEQLAIIDALDVPACLVFTGKPVQPLNLNLPDRGHGPCEDCIPDPTFLDRLAARWRHLRCRLRRHG